MLSPQRRHPCVPSSRSAFAGRGGREGLDVRCPKCHGSGVEVIVHQLGPNMVHHIQAMCSQCQGQGEWLRPLDRCLACNGRKVVREKKILNVHLDKGEVGGLSFAGFPALVPPLWWLPFRLFGPPSHLQGTSSVTAAWLQIPVSVVTLVSFNPFWLI